MKCVRTEDLNLNTVISLTGFQYGGNWLCRLYGFLIVMLQDSSIELWMSVLVNPPSHLTPWPHNGKNELQSHYIPATPALSHRGVCASVCVHACVCACSSAIHNILCLPFDLLQPNESWWNKETRTFDIKTRKRQKKAEQKSCCSKHFIMQTYSLIAILRGCLVPYLLPQLCYRATRQTIYALV